MCLHQCNYFTVGLPAFNCFSLKKPKNRLSSCHCYNSRTVLGRTVLYFNTHNLATSSFWEAWLRFGYSALFSHKQSFLRVEEEEQWVQITPSQPPRQCPLFKWPIGDYGCPYWWPCPSQEPVFGHSGLFKLQRQVQGSHSSGPFVLYQHNINTWQLMGPALSAFTSLRLELTPRFVRLWWPERCKTQLCYQWKATSASQALKSLEGLV